MLTISLSCFQELSIRLFSSAVLPLNLSLEVFPYLKFFEFPCSCLGFGSLEQLSVNATDLRAAVAAARDKAATASGRELLGPSQVGIHSSRVVANFRDFQSSTKNLRYRRQKS
jgi:hypothetical protein